MTFSRSIHGIKTLPGLDSIKYAAARVR